MKGLRRAGSGAVAFTAASLILAVASPAHAAAAATGTAQSVVPADPCVVLAWHYGQALCGSHAVKADWDGNGTWDEVFVIAPDHTIWHDWPTSGGWREMPNNGSADDVQKAYINGNGQRQVEVCVKASHSVWYSYYSGGWRGWYRYSGATC